MDGRWKKTETWQEQTPEGVIENDRYKILWDVTIKCDHVVSDRIKDIVVVV